MDTEMEADMVTGMDSETDTATHMDMDIHDHRIDDVL
jgi:hypothetical protein